MFTEKPSVSHRLTVLLADWELTMRSQSLSARTIEERLRAVVSVSSYSDIDADLLGPRQIEQWLASKPTAGTRWTYFTHLRAFFRWLEVTKQRVENPLLELIPPKRPKYNPRPIAEIHIKNTLAQKLRPSTRLQIQLAVVAGLRVSEIASITGSNYDPAAGVLTVESKGGQLKAIPLHSELRDAINEMHLPSRGYWFPSPKGGHISGKSVSQNIREAFSRAGVTIQAHQLRHSFGTQLLGNGADIRVVQTLMRHESIQSTAIYTRVSEPQQSDALELLTYHNERNE